MNRMTPQLSVLLVEDDANVRLGCEQAMQLAGIAVTSVASAEEAQTRIAPSGATLAAKAAKASRRSSIRG